MQIQLNNNQHIHMSWTDVAKMANQPIAKRVFKLRSMMKKQLISWDCLVCRQTLFGLPPYTITPEPELEGGKQNIIRPVN